MPWESCSSPTDPSHSSTSNSRERCSFRFRTSSRIPSSNASERHELKRPTWRRSWRVSSHGGRAAGRRPARGGGGNTQDKAGQPKYHRAPEEPGGDGGG